MTKKSRTRKGRGTRSAKVELRDAPQAPTSAARDRARRVPKTKLRWTCPRLPALDRAIRKEKTLEPHEGRTLRRRLRVPVKAAEIFGQDHALGALRAGLALEGPTGHIFICGPGGYGRRALAFAAAEDVTLGLPKPRDRVLVNEFRADGPDTPLLITLPRGKGRRFRQDLEDLLSIACKALRTAFESEDSQRRRDRILKGQEAREKELFGGVLERASQAGFKIPNLVNGELMFNIERRAYTREQLLAALERGTITIRGRKALLAAHDRLSQELREAQAKVRELNRAMPRLIRALERSIIERSMSGYLRDLALQYPTPAVKQYLDSYQVGLCRHFLSLVDEEEEDEAAITASFGANLLVDSLALGDRAAVHVLEPSHRRLFGWIDSDATSTDLPEFLKLRAGALLECEGGVIVMSARDLLADSSCWKALRRCMVDGAFPLALDVGCDGTPLAAKIVLFGTEDDYQQLMDLEDWDQVFTVKVEIETRLPHNTALLGKLALALRGMALRHGLLPPNAEALRRAIEWGTRMCSRHGHASLRFASYLSLLREADATARAAGAQELDSGHVAEALATRRQRHSLQERLTQALISDGIVLIDAGGARSGQVNALVIYENGDFAFARPCRITATVSVGWKGVIDIEREAQLSGDAHHKGVQIITGLLRTRFAADKPLSVTAALCFEQSYSHIDGDSASAAEVIVILSALADAPINQSIAISGSVNQHGDLQAVGGVNEKIEGYYDACMVAGLSGKHAVLIPEANVADLSLRDDVAEAVCQKRFHVYSAATLDAAMRLMMDLEPEIIHQRVDKRLRDFAEIWRDFRQA